MLKHLVDSLQAGKTMIGSRDEQVRVMSRERRNPHQTPRWPGTHQHYVSTSGPILRKRILVSFRAKNTSFTRQEIEARTYEPVGLS